jgi:hypothetical protein
MRNVVKMIVDNNTDSIATGANGGYVENLWNLHTLMDSYRTDDGVKKRIHFCRIGIRLYSASAVYAFTLLPVVVQTAGTFTDTINQSSRIVDSLIAAAIDDVFGYDPLGNTRFSKIVAGDGTLAGSIHSIETTIQLQPKHLQILNKEVESERLQDLYVGFVGVADSDLSLQLNSQIEIGFTEQRQAVVIR